MDTSIRVFSFVARARSFQHQLIFAWVSFTDLVLQFGYFLLTEFRGKLFLMILNLAECLKFEFGLYWLNQAFDLVAYCPVC